MKLKHVLLPVVTLMSLVACQKPEVPDTAVIDTTKSEYTVSILQIVGAPALEIARKAFKDALDSSPLMDGKHVTYREMNANGNQAQEQIQAKSLVVGSDLLLGISTPSACDLKNARNENGVKQPLLFTAVTDPVDASLAKSFPHHNGSVTGTSDDNPVESQIQLIKRCMPDKEASKIKLGIFYTSSETNSAVQARRAKKAAQAEGLKKSNIIVKTFNEVADLESTCRSLASQVDVMYIPTDNNCADNMLTIKEIVNAAHVLCIVGEENMLNGGHITYSVSYEYLGRRTGEMAAQIISGDKETHEIDIEKSLNPDDWNKVYSSANIEAASLTIPASVLAEFTDVDA